MATAAANLDEANIIRVWTHVGWVPSRRIVKGVFFRVINDIKDYLARSVELHWAKGDSGISPERLMDDTPSQPPMGPITSKSNVTSMSVPAE